jgi:hypothetical protein
LLGHPFYFGFFAGGFAVAPRSSAVLVDEFQNGGPLLAVKRDKAARPAGSVLTGKIFEQT